MAIGYYNEPNFRWWMHKELNKHDRFVKRVKSRYRNNRFKFGVEVFVTFEYALNIDSRKWQQNMAQIYWERDEEL